MRGASGTRCAGRRASCTRPRTATRRPSGRWPRWPASATSASTPRSARPHAALYGRAANAVAGWLGAPPAHVHLGEHATLTRTPDGVEATLPFAWLVRVWARGLAVMAGRFCLDAATEDGRTFTLTTVAPDLGPPQPMTLTMPA